MEPTSLDLSSQSGPLDCLAIAASDWGWMKNAANCALELPLDFYLPKTLMLKLHFLVFPDRSVAETTTVVVPILNFDIDVNAGTLKTLGR